MKIGFIGLGEIGLPAAKNLLAAGYSVQGLDLRDESLTELEAAGGSRARDTTTIVADNDVIMTALPSSAVFVDMADKQLLPRATAGKIFIELGTTVPKEIRRLAMLFQQKGAFLLDSPVSGGQYGAENGTLRMWPAGDENIYKKCLPILQVIGAPDEIVYCGESGMGQVMKGINQLRMGLYNAVQLEILAFAHRSGMPMETVEMVFPDMSLIKAVKEGQAEWQNVKFRELPYFIEEMEAQGYEMPITRTVYDFCDKGERVVVDDHRDAPSYWHELLQKREEEMLT